MPDYLVTGITAEGRRKVDRVTATSARDALATMRERGYAQVELHTDDSMASIQPLGKSAEGIREHVSPKLHLSLQESSRVWSTVLLMGASYRKLWPLVVFAIGALVIRRAIGRP